MRLLLPNLGFSARGRCKGLACFFALPRGFLLLRVISSPHLCMGEASEGFGESSGAWSNFRPEVPFVLSASSFSKVSPDSPSRSFAHRGRQAPYAWGKRELGNR